MIFDRLSKDISKDEYFLELYELILKNIVIRELVLDQSINIDEKQLIHLLRFSDILSNSSLSEYRNMAYRIIAFLSPIYNDSPIYKTYSTAVLSKLGNFPAMKNFGHQVELPFVREIEKNVKKEIQKVPGTDDLFFTDSQFSLFQRLKDSNFYSFSGPTSMGKSFIIKTFIYEKINQNKSGNFAVIVPTRALINQFSHEIKRDLRSVLENTEYKVTTNSMMAADSETDHKFIFVLTPERLLSYISNKKSPPIDYLFIDEAHKLAAEKDYRSITMYLSAEKSIKRYPSIKVYFASPNVSNPEAFLELFEKNTNKTTFSTTESPVTQNLFFIDLLSRETSYYSEGKKYIFPDISINHYSSCLELIYSVGEGTSNVIYCNSVENTINKAKDFLTFLKSKRTNVSSYNMSKLQELIEETSQFIHKEYYLVDCLEQGVAFHFGNLPQVIRNKVEKLFKVGVIKYLFCTSTLLEGVNLPAKNIFILSNKKHKSNMSKIDFWNLAGRAGRLNHELYGNIFCVRDNAKEWKNLEVITGKSTTILLVNATHQLSKNDKKIEIVFEEKEISSTEAEKDVLKYLANIISIDSLDNSESYRSPVINKLLKEGKTDLLEKAKKYTEGVNVPIEILNNSQAIMVKQQHQVYDFINSNKNHKELIKLSSEVNYESCLAALELLHDKYKWIINESKNDIGNKNSLRYYAAIMNQWINGQSLNGMINTALAVYEKSNRSLMFYEGGKQVFEKYNKSKRHINKIINNLITDIENIIRYKLEKYFNNYHALLSSVLGEDNAGMNWNVFLEYGTRDTISVYLQNMGFSRHVSTSLVKDFKDALNIKDGKLISINKSKLNLIITPGTPEYDEVNLIL